MEPPPLGTAGALGALGVLTLGVVPLTVLGAEAPELVGVADEEAPLVVGLDCGLNGGVKGFLGLSPLSRRR